MASQTLITQLATSCWVAVGIPAAFLSLRTASLIYFDQDILSRCLKSLFMQTSKSCTFNVQLTAVQLCWCFVRWAFQQHLHLCSLESCQEPKGTYHLPSQLLVKLTVCKGSTLCQCTPSSVPHLSSPALALWPQCLQGPEAWAAFFLEWWKHFPIGCNCKRHIYKCRCLLASVVFTITDLAPTVSTTLSETRSKKMRVSSVLLTKASGWFFSANFLCITPKNVVIHFSWFFGRCWARKVFFSKSQVVASQKNFLPTLCWPKKLDFRVGSTLLLFPALQLLTVEDVNLSSLKFTTLRQTPLLCCK